MAILWGARIDSEVYGTGGDAPWDAATWDRYERNTEKRVSLVHWGQPWGKLEVDALHKADARGAVSMVDYEALGATMGSVASGQEDAAIDAIADRCRGYGKRLLIRPWWEMNGAWFPWGRQKSYVAAFRRFHDRVRAKAPLAEFVWCVNALWDDPKSDPAPYFPGERYCEWTGIDGYCFGQAPGYEYGWRSPTETFQPTLKRLAELAPNRKIAICETGCSEYGGSKPAWIRRLLLDYLPRHNRIGALVYFNAYGREGIDWPIESSPKALAAFRAGIASDHYRPGGA